jgi:DNA processing protein
MRDIQDDDPVDRLRLIRSRRVGAVTYHRLVAEHGSARAALAALPEVARAAGVEDYAPCPVEVARHEMAQARLAGAVMLIPGGPGYPAGLEEMPDAPPILWARGDVAWLSRPMVAMVGARNASSLGVRMARRLSGALGGAGHVVVSGLARGIDTEAHLAALVTGTVAVMAGGVDVIYPEENIGLAARIAETGCLISEQPMGMQPQARHFPLRNRIIAGMARAVVVVEAAARSGSLITARDALDLGREVLAVPGHPFDARAAGCNMLIRDGAVLVRSAEDVLEAIGGGTGNQGRAEDAIIEGQVLGMERSGAPVSAAGAVGAVAAEAGLAKVEGLPGPVPARRPLIEVAALHGMILDRLGPSAVAEDQLIRDLDLPTETVARELVALEMEGRVLRQAGGLLSRC